MLSAQEIVKNLGTIPSMKKSFDNFKFPAHLNLDNKIKILVGLIKGMSEVDEFHNLVSIKSEKMQLLTK